MEALPVVEASNARERPFLSWGELLWDLFPDGPRLGGAAANLAYHLAQLGRPAYLVSRVGNDELGKRALRELQRAGVRMDYVQVDPIASTGTVSIQLTQGEPSYHIATEVAWDQIEITPELTLALQSARAICFGTLAQRTPLMQTHLERALGALPSDCLRVCDLNLRPPFVDRGLIQKTLCQANVVKLNEHELALVGTLVSGVSALDWLFAQTSVRLVAVTLGAAGCELHTKGESVSAPGVQRDTSSGDQVGAGDAFSAVLLNDLVEGRPLAEVARRANSYASAVAAARGGMPSGVGPDHLKPDSSRNEC